RYGSCPKSARRLPTAERTTATSFSLVHHPRDAAPPPDDPGNPTVNFHGEKRSNATHASITDSDALLYKKAKGHEAKLSYLGHVLIENRHGLVVNSRLTQATGRAEWEAAWAMAKQIPGRRRGTLGADKHYDDRD